MFSRLGAIRCDLAWALVPLVVLGVLALVPLRCSVPPTAPVEDRPSAQASIAGAWVSIDGGVEDHLTFVESGGRFTRLWAAQGDTVSWWGQYSLMSTRSQGYIQFIIERVLAGGRDFEPDPPYFFLAAYVLTEGRLVIEGVTYVRGG